MGDTTTNRDYRKPLSTDDPVDLTSFWRNMADDIDADVALILTQRGIVAAPVTGGSNGTATSGTTEIKDSGVSDYSFTALAGVRYRVVLQGRGLLPTASGARYACNIRYAASSPTTSSTLVGENSTFVAASTIAFTCNVAPSFIPGAGAVHLGVFWVQISGTGTATPTGGFEFYAEAIGTV